jgi:protein-S-isoprenylcysteine O-methyltransferase Ste14
MIKTIFLSLYIIAALCLWILLSAIILNFCFSRKSGIKKEKKSIVETGSMFGFFVFLALLVSKNIGLLSLNIKLALLVATIGAAFILMGTIINIMGRLKLKGNWSNQIRIYENHTLIKTGIYRYIRHPLYSSTILMIYGFSFLFINPMVFLLNTIIFIPFMIYRARQEDELLHSMFEDEFIEYESRTGLFMLKIRKRG